MRRRAYLAAAGATVLGGCLGSGAAATPEETGQPTDGGVDPSPAPPSSTVLQFGDWHATATTDVTVSGTETIARLRGDASTPADVLPSGTKLVVVSGAVENTTESELALADTGVSFGVVASEQLFESVASAGSEQLAGRIEESLDTADTHLSGTARVAPTERLPVWQAVLVPESLSTAGVQVTLCADDCAVRWEPSSKTCDCPG